MDLPIGLERRRHLERGAHSALPRRITLVLLTILCILALLNLFGQRATTTTMDSAAASLNVHSPEQLRGGIVYTTQITITAHQRLNDLRMLLSSDWFKGMTFNGMVPQPNNQSSTAQGVLFDYGQMDAGQTLPIWISWQTNPVTVGSRSPSVVLYDGQNTLLIMRRPLTVFP